jgi:CRP-like cAMP-binding protein
MDTQPIRNDMTLQFLQKLDLFEGVSQNGLETIAGVCRCKQIPKGTYIFFQGDPANMVFLVWQGAIAIQLEDPEGRELVINEMKPGDCFGELGIITAQPRSTSAEAIVDTDLLLIPGSVFNAVLEKEPSLVRHLLDINAQRLQNSSKREEALAFHDAKQRLARQLLLLDELASDKGYLTYSQEDLAQRAGLTRQTVTTILGHWKTRGWLLTGRGHIVLLNRKALKLLAQAVE